MFAKTEVVVLGTLKLIDFLVGSTANLHYKCVLYYSREHPVQFTEYEAKQQAGGQQ